jgi:transcriptional regulator with GAF, ATPase, and Fis domain
MHPPVHLIGKHQGRSVRQLNNLRQIERSYILAVLEQCGWKIQGAGNAAAQLGIKPSTLRWRMKKLGIERPG